MTTFFIKGNIGNICHSVAKTRQGRAERPPETLVNSGEPRGGRTHDHLIKSQVLYQLS